MVSKKDVETYLVKFQIYLHMVLVVIGFTFIFMSPFMLLWYPAWVCIITFFAGVLCVVLGFQNLPFTIWPGRGVVHEYENKGDLVAEENINFFKVFMWPIYLIAIWALSLFPPVFIAPIPEQDFLIVFLLMLLATLLFAGLIAGFLIEGFKRNQIQIFENGFIPATRPMSYVWAKKELFIPWDDVVKFKRLYSDEKWAYMIRSKHYKDEFVLHHTNFKKPHTELLNFLKALDDRFNIIQTDSGKN